jgi:hypothetical protein
MEVTEAWSTQYAGRKVAVTLNEGDLVRVLIQFNIDPAVADKLTAREAFLILHTTAIVFAKFTERRHCIAQAKAAQQPVPPEAAQLKADMDEAVAERAKILASYLPKPSDKTPEPAAT